MSIDDLGRRIEQLVAEHIAAARKVAQEAVARALGAATHHVPAMVPVRPLRRPAQPRAATSRTQARRPPEEVAALGERLYEAVCAHPGMGMAMLSKEVGAGVRALHRPMTLLRRAGRIRSVGTRRLTRYFPMVAAVASA
jgi:hypothetical protein